MCFIRKFCAGWEPIWFSAIIQIQILWTTTTAVLVSRLNTFDYLCAIILMNNITLPKGWRSYWGLKIETVVQSFHDSCDEKLLSRRRMLFMIKLSDILYYAARMNWNSWILRLLGVHREIGSFGSFILCKQLYPATLGKTSNLKLSTLHCHYYGWVFWRRMLIGFAHNSAIFSGCIFLQISNCCCCWCRLFHSWGNNHTKNALLALYIKVYFYYIYSLFMFKQLCSPFIDGSILV